MRVQLIIVALFLSSMISIAQEPTFMGAATHPGKGQFYSRALAFSSADDDSTALLKLAYGIHPNLALLLDGQYEWLDAAADRTTTTIRLKYRILRKDLGPLNTWRASVIGGIEKTEYMDPGIRLGVVTTAILGRHGLNGELDWAGQESLPDEFMLNGSYLYRLAPAEYAADTKAAWYTMLESLNTFWDNGDSRIDLAPGLLYEAQKWAAEISLRLPVTENDISTPSYTAAVGLRYLF